jgi:hypothetical protein
MNPVGFREHVRANTTELIARGITFSGFGVSPAAICLRSAGPARPPARCSR